MGMSMLGLEAGPSQSDMQFPSLLPPPGRRLGTGPQAQTSQHFLEPVFSAGIILSPALLPQQPGPQPFTCSGFLEPHNHLEMAWSPF